MIVITLSNCPDALRGDLTKWLMEITTGVFVGHVSARIRERLWERVRGHVRGGRATMVFSAANEQRLAFRITNSEWTPVDFDGLELMMRPHGGYGGAVGESPLQPGYSKAAGRMRARRMAASGARRSPARNASPVATPSSYVVIDIETTGLSPDKDSIIEVSALRICDGVAKDSYSSLIKADSEIPVKIVELTGITDEMLREVGQDVSVALPEFLAFIGDFPMVAHNARFDMSFLNVACKKHGFPVIDNDCTDTLFLSKQQVKGISSYSLKYLTEYFKLDDSAKTHRGLSDCILVHHLYEKLMKTE